uniref:Activin_recp domain-containing protein n=1 Tax=Heterorhabditis bacteriophora TaxID=37862 RepID=A0A1I7WRB0_HETBA
MRVGGQFIYYYAICSIQGCAVTRDELGYELICACETDLCNYETVAPKEGSFKLFVKRKLTGRCGNSGAVSALIFMATAYPVLYVIFVS